jgi:rhodanese-related sulfurtransferase
MLLLVVLVLAAFAVTACSPAASSNAASVQVISPNQYVSDFSQPQTAHLLVDVRTPEEYATGHIAGSVNIPLQELSSRMSEIPTNQPVVIYCRSGNRSAQAADLLKNAGYSQLYDLGGIIAWAASGLPVQ